MDGCSCTVFRNLCCCTRCFRCKNFCLLPAVFRSRSFDYVVFTQAKLCAMQVSQVGNFFARRFVAKTAKTFVFYLLFFAVEVLIVSCLHRQKPYKTSFVGGQVFRTSVCCKICKNFCLLPAVFRSRSFDYVVLNRQKPYKTSFVGGQVFCPQRFFVQ